MNLNPSIQCVRLLFVLSMLGPLLLPRDVGAQTCGAATIRSRGAALRGAQTESNREKKER